MSAVSLTNKNGMDSDSDDEDYIPDNGKEDASGSSDEREPKRVRTSPTPPKLTEEEVTAQEQARKAFWSDFQTAATAPSPRADRPWKRTVKIEKRYRFAGEDVTEVKEVDADSEEAKKWPVWHPPPLPDTTTSPSAASPSPAGVVPSAETPEASTSNSALPTTTPPAAGKRPGRRKPKVQLADLPSTSSQKAKKISTLEKSAMDWQAHLESQKETQLKDELAANRKGGGYLEKVEFLQRVEERKDQALEASSDRKRRRG